MTSPRSISPSIEFSAAVVNTDNVATDLSENSPLHEINPTSATEARSQSGSQSAINSTSSGRVRADSFDDLPPPPPPSPPLTDESFIAEAEDMPPPPGEEGIYGSHAELDFSQPTTTAGDASTLRRQGTTFAEINHGATADRARSSPAHLTDSSNNDKEDIELFDHVATAGRAASADEQPRETSTFTRKAVMRIKKAPEPPPRISIPATASADRSPAVASSSAPRVNSPVASASTSVVSALVESRQLTIDALQRDYETLEGQLSSKGKGLFTRTKEAKTFLAVLKNFIHLCKTDPRATQDIKSAASKLYELHRGLIDWSNSNMSLSESGKDPFQYDFSDEITTLKVMQKIKEIINPPVVSSAPVISRANVVIASTPARQVDSDDGLELPDIAIPAPLPLQSNDYTEIASSGNLTHAPGFLSRDHSRSEIESILKGKPPGTYLIRFSTSDTNKSALSFVNNRGQVIHVRTNRNGDVTHGRKTYNICKTADVQLFLRAAFSECEDITCKPYNAPV